MAPRDDVASGNRLPHEAQPTTAILKRGRLTEPFIWDYVVALRSYRPLVIADALGDGLAWPESAVVVGGRPGRIDRVGGRLARALAGEETRPFEARRGRAAKCIEDAIVKSDARVLHAHYGQTGVWASRTLERRPPMVVTFYCNDLFVFGKYPHWKAAYRRLFLEADLLLVLSEYIRDFLLELGAPPEKVQIDRQAIDLGTFSFREPAPRARPVVLCVSNFQPKKGLVYLVRAFAAIRAKHPDAVLRLLGGGEEEARVRSEIELLGIGDSVEILPPVPYDELPRVFDEADVFVLPSVMSTDFDIDEISMVIVEAMAVGLPVVTTHHAGIPEVIHDGENGLLAEERSVESLAAALDSVLGDTASWPRLARAARATVEEMFDIHKQARVLEARYDALAGSA